MKTLLSLLLLPLLLTLSATAETIPLLKAAELTTKSLAEIKVAGKPMSDFFQVTALVRQPAPETSDPAAVEWRAILAGTKLERAGEETKALFAENRKEYRRVLEIHSDGTVTLGKIAGGMPRPRVVPAPKK
ncbi:MAG: hypothetical protein EOP88_02100 [Verrucomicrobiaceae bacterium]|nr:MAG: hypothetical protein EOP88_02100 [Verrucomicrobiaceae bacterium]